MAISILPIFAAELIEPRVIWALVIPAQIVALALGARLSLTLPAIAIGDPSELRAVWGLSRGHMVEVVVAVGLPILGLLGVTLLMPEPGATGLATVEVLLGLVTALMVAFQITVLSVCYRELRSRAMPGEMPAI
jgi:hypothetical protein